MEKLPALLPPIRPLGRKWSMDAAGPFEQSVLGNRYFFVLVSDDTKTAYIYFAKSLKSYADISAMVVEDIKNTLLLMGETEIQVQISLRFMQIKSDQASYFTSNKNTVSYTNNGIRTTFSGVYNGFQNCYAERIIGTICSSAYTMRHHANAPKNVWDFAILLAWEIYDNSAHSKLPNNMSPRQFRTGQKQNLFSYLHIFWGLTAIWIPPAQRNKTESKAKFGRYAGYDRQSRSHWVLVPTSSGKYRIHRSQHIRVDPRPFPPRAPGCLMPPLTDGPIAELNHTTQLESTKFNKQQMNLITQMKQYLFSQMETGDLAYVTPCTKGWFHVTDESGDKAYYTTVKGRRSLTCPDNVDAYPDTHAFVFSKGIPIKPPDKTETGTVTQKPLSPPIDIPTNTPKPVPTRVHDTRYRAKQLDRVKHYTDLLHVMHVNNEIDVEHDQVIFEPLQHEVSTIKSAKSNDVDLNPLLRNLNSEGTHKHLPVYDPITAIMDAVGNNQHKLAADIFRKTEREGRWLIAPGEYIFYQGSVYPLPTHLDNAKTVTHTVRAATVAQNTNLPWSDKIWYSYANASADPIYGHLFRKPSNAIDKEMSTLDRHGTIQPIDTNELPVGATINRLLTIFSLKRGGNPNDPNNVWGKLRIVFDGTSEHPHGVSSTNIPSLDNIRTFCAIYDDPNDDIIAMTCDIPCAYTQTVRDDRHDQSKQVFTYLPIGLWPPDPKTGKPQLAKIGNLYGRRDAGNQYQRDRDRTLIKEGYTQCKMEPAMFTNPITRVRACILTDDFLIIGNRTAVHQLFTILENRYSEKPGDLKPQILSDEWVPFNGALLRRVNHQIEWSTHRAIDELLAVQISNNIATNQLPSAPLKSISKHDVQKVDHKDPNQRDCNPIRTKQYYATQGSLNWICQLGRPDFATTNSQNASVMAGPAQSHTNRHLQTIQYLKFTRELVLTWNPSNHTYTDKDGKIIQVERNQLLYYSDGSFAAEGIGQSRIGYVAILNGGVIGWGTNLTKFQTTGIMDAEEAAAAWACKDISYRRELMRELGHEQLHPTALLCDNMATISFTEPSAILSTLSKHILVRGAYTRECERNGIIKITFVPGKYNLADNVTKVQPKNLLYGVSLPNYGFTKESIPNVPNI